MLKENTQRPPVSPETEQNGADGALNAAATPSLRRHSFEEEERQKLRSQETEDENTEAPDEDRPEATGWVAALHDLTARLRRENATLPQSPETQTAQPTRAILGMISRAQSYLTHRANRQPASPAPGHRPPRRSGAAEAVTNQLREGLASAASLVPVVLRTRRNRQNLRAATVPTKLNPNISAPSVDTTDVQIS